MKLGEIETIVIDIACMHSMIGENNSIYAITIWDWRK